MSWLDNIFPNEEKWENIRASVMSIKDNLAGKMELGEYE